MKEKLTDVLDELEVWLPSEPEGFAELVGRVLASLPGGDDLDGIFEPLPIGWNEANLLGKLLLALESPRDVRTAVERLFANIRV
jgi:hypothetical protein